MGLSPTLATKGTPSRRVAVYLLSGLFSIFLSASILCQWSSQALQMELFSISDDTEFDWKTILPTSDLKWVDCYEHRQCARLKVPLDYSDPTGEEAAIALLRVKSKLSSTGSEYRGPVLFNPGGPGVSGTQMIKTAGESFQTVLGEEYDIVGFDPRGIGETTPALSSFTDQWERAYWNAGAPPLLNSSSDSFPRAYARSQLFGELGEKYSKHAAQHVGTADVARDMLTITKAHGRDRLLYWGLSYGTILGATYAAMFPNNIERMIIDGVVDFDDYHTGKWSKNLFDTDKVLQYFYDKCVEAGPLDCPLHANSSSLVHHRVEKIFTSIKDKPIPAVHETDYDIIDYSSLKTGLFVSLYQPFDMLRPYADVLAALEKGDGRPAVAYLKQFKQRPKCDSPLVVLPEIQETLVAVMCGDVRGAGVNNTISDIAHHLEEQSKISVFADVWAGTTRMHCAGWKIRSKEMFEGPFEANTSFPLLVIGNTADPVTPLIGAKKVANAFSGSALLTVNTPGHCSIAATSLCTTRVIRQYFREGKLPDDGLVCEVEDQLFGEKLKIAEPLPSKDQKLLEATRFLVQNLYPVGGWRVL